MSKTGRRIGGGGRVEAGDKSSVLDMLRLSCLLGIQVEMSRRWVDI